MRIKIRHLISSTIREHPVYGDVYFNYIPCTRNFETILQNAIMETVTEERLTDGVRARRVELVALKKDLIRNTTLHPPGLNYREICSDVAERLGKAGFAAEMFRAEGGGCRKHRSSKVGTSGRG
ncbi:hypothetical protein [Actibacterium sp. 188UL27-1]|uniref:hypothetical protein n=1 Tax=Actibacterium sp. 188UL27-1 TaxID=2786961 RepID=UPI0019581BD9|nr:hypothetical protein [Actibacterium sp. 188UL27-1]MBM7066378.1 hypothetical protein [Actibacterium sp. 188UL27-1]